MAITHKNHYVPVWYQKRFLADEHDSLYHLDISPRTVELSNGRVFQEKAIHIWGPKKCFWAEDLYTTSFFGMPNDEIERYLFGAIDATGSEATRALVDNDLSALYHLFFPFFEYMDAQKIRTPKGLDWIRSRYPALSQGQLMREMQMIRRMHCTMWAEGVREIVSAKEASVKFILSDHPVTVYNHACPPDSELCKYPEDPSIAKKASQTLFPLDLNHCLILTNLEYARSPKNVDPLSNRTHARHFGQTVVKFDTTIRSRLLDNDQVTAINYILKMRAKNHIAASNREDLFPDKNLDGPWSNIGAVLLPEKDKLWEFGGEIYIGGNAKEDVYYLDEFGRTTGQSDWLRKERQDSVGPNDLCPCGSGKKYKKCCQDRPESKRTSFDEYSIRERNLILINAAFNILGIDKGKTWEDVRREISDEQVRRIYSVVAGLWPRETDLMNLLPHPDSKVVRALYAGIVDPRVIIPNVIGMSLYFDEVVVLSPFVNPLCIKPKYSPLHSPEQYKQQTIKDTLLLFYLAPLIDAGIVNLVPDPSDFNHSLRESTWDMAQSRLEDWKPSLEEMANFKALSKDDFMRTMCAAPDESVKRQLRKANPGISEERLCEALRDVKEMRARDPLAVLQDVKPGEENGQYMVSHVGPNLEMTLFLAQLTGSLTYSDMPHKWREILAADDTSRSVEGEQFSEFERTLSRKFLVFGRIAPEVALQMRILPRLARFRSAIRSLWAMKVSGYTDWKDSEKVRIELDKAIRSLPVDWETIRNKDRKAKSRFAAMNPIEAWFDWRLPSAGFGINTAYRLLLTHSGRNDYLSSLPMAIFVRYAE